MNSANGKARRQTLPPVIQKWGMVEHVGSIPRSADRKTKIFSYVS
jgi:hypothetical protein